MKYIGVKIVEAEPMDVAEAVKAGYRGADPSIYGRGFEVTYPGGYKSWCPYNEFMAYNRPSKGMPFGHAIEAARQGNKITRVSWNRKNMFVVMMPALNLLPFNTQDTKRKVNDRTAKFIGEDVPLNCVPYFAMYAANKDWVPGWLASQTDMLADDWQVVE